MLQNLSKVFRLTTMLNQARTKNIYTENLYMEFLQSKDYAEGGVAEVVGDPTKQVKPYFDFDSYEIDLNDQFKQEFIDYVKEEYGKDVSLMSRAPRLKDGKMKYSFRAYIKGHRISFFLIPIYFQALFKKYEGIIDTSVYKINQPLLTLGNKRKRDLNVPPLEMDNPNEDISNVFATYIEEDYVNLDDQVDAKVRDELYAKFMKKVEAKKDEKERVKEEVEEDDCEDENPSVDKIKGIIDHLKPFRADGFDNWLSGDFAIIGYCKKYNINKRSCLDLIHHFSAIFPDKYDEDKVDDWFNSNYRRQMEREGNQYGKGLLLKWLKEDDLDYYNEKFRPKKTYAEVAKFVNSRVFKMDNLELYLVANERHDRWDTDVIGQYTKNALKHKFAQNYDYVYYDKKTNKKDEVSYEQINMFDGKSNWWKDTSIKKYDKFVFIPDVDEECPDYYYNLFQGFAIDKYPVCSTNANLEVIMYHINNVLGNGDKASSDFILQWYAHILMGKKTNVCIMQQGIEGGGKTLMYDKFAENIIGKKYTFTTSKPAEQLFGRFNDHLGNKLIVKIEEGTAELRSHMDKFKDMITGTELAIEAKFAKTTTLQNNINPIICTNNFNILSPSINDRRFAIFETNPEHVGDTEYFDRLGDALNNMETMSAFANMLRIDVYIPEYNFQKSRPKTRIYKRLVQTNVSNVFQFIKSYDYEWRTYRGETYTIIKRTKLYSDYKDYALENKFECYNLNAFENKLTENPKYGIKLVEYQKSPSYKITKDVFLTAMKNFDIEDMPVFDDFEFLDD